MLCDELLPYYKIIGVSLHERDKLGRKLLGEEHAAGEIERETDGQETHGAKNLAREFGHVQNFWVQETRREHAAKKIGRENFRQDRMVGEIRREILGRRIWAEIF